MKFEKFEQPPSSHDEVNNQEKQPEKEEDLLQYEPGVGIRFTELLKKEVQEKEKAAKKLEYDKLRDYLKFEQKEINGPIIEEARIRRNQLLEGRGIFKMSKADFDTYFSSSQFEVNANLNQQNVGDCYVLAAIHAMSRSPHFEMICRSSMRRLPDGLWEVDVPLMSDESETITITPEDISPQKNIQFLKRNRKRKEIIPDFRRELRPVKGKEGLQVLEAAYIKAKFGKVDRLASEGGRPEEALILFGGDNFRKYSIRSEIWDEERGRFEYPGLVSLDEIDMGYLDHYLENFDPEIHIATATSKGPNFYKVPGTKEVLVPNHAYSVSKIDPRKKIITLANPWDTSKPIEFTFDQFKQSFSAFKAVRVDSAQLLSSMERILNKYN